MRINRKKCSKMSEQNDRERKHDVIIFNDRKQRKESTVPDKSLSDLHLSFLLFCVYLSSSKSNPFVRLSCCAVFDALFNSG